MLVLSENEAIFNQGWTWVVSPRSILDSNRANFRISSRLSTYSECSLAHCLTITIEAQVRNDHQRERRAVRSMLTIAIIMAGRPEAELAIYRFIIRVNYNGNGYTDAILTRWENGVEPRTKRSFVALARRGYDQPRGLEQMQIDPTARTSSLH